MTDETENLVLELLRAMRGDMDGLRREVAVLRTEMRERLDAVETQLEGLRYVFVASTGSLVTDLKDHGIPLAALEGARA